jgi:hypothetical protein
MAVTNDWRILAARLRVTQSGKACFLEFQLGQSQERHLLDAHGGRTLAAATNLTPDLFMFNYDDRFLNAFDVPCCRRPLV